MMGYAYMSSKSLESMFWKVHRGQTFLVMFVYVWHVFVVYFATKECTRIAAHVS